MILTEELGRLGRRAREISGLGRPTYGEPTPALFVGIRWRLTLMYSTVLAGALILSGLVLYLGVQQSLLAPIRTELHGVTAELSTGWLDQPGLPCPLLSRDSLEACYDARGQLMIFTDLVRHDPQFLPNGLALAALRSGSATDTVNPHLEVLTSAVQRYAVRVRAADGVTLGVIQFGLPVGSQLSTLSTLLHLLLILGLLTLLLSAGVGLFLANRALLPARLAYARQRDFIADASHELRTPLTMLRSSVELVLRDATGLPPEDVALLEDTVQETAHLTSLANSMLSLARLDSDTARMEFDVIDLGEIAGEVVRWAQPLAQEREIDISFHRSCQSFVLGERSLLEQAVLILIDNAIKYNSREGSVAVTVGASHHDASVTVKDTGVGVSAEHLKRLGERFYRVDKARSRESGGAGLGLSIARSILSRHGGMVTLTSEPGHGTCATLSLPAVEVRPLEESPSQPTAVHEVTGP